MNMILVIMSMLLTVAIISMMTTVFGWLGVIPTVILFMLIATVVSL